MKLVPLSVVADVNPRFSKDYDLCPADEVAFLPMDAVSEGGSVAYQQRRRMADVTNGYTSFKRGDIILAKITPCMENGKAAFLDSLETECGFGSTEFHVIRPSDKLDGRYAFYLIWNPRFRRFAESRMTGSAGQKRVPANFLKELEVPVPPLAEQRRIAAILDKADAIRRKHEQALALADDFLRSAFLHLFGDPEINPHGWQKRLLEKCTSPSRQITYGIVQAGPDVDDGIPYIKTGDFNGNKIRTDNLARTSHKIASKYKRSEVRTGDLVFCIRASVGAVAIVPPQLDGANLTQGTALIAPGSELDNRYLVAALQTKAVQEWISRHSKGATFKEITLETLRKTPIPVPPKQLQARFASVFDQMVAHRLKLTEAVDEAGSLFHSLSQRAFRGEL